jgi:hypothetical protein
MDQQHDSRVPHNNWKFIFLLKYVIDFYRETKVLREVICVQTVVEYTKK